MSEESNTSSDWREVRRIRAWELHQQGWSQSQIAAELGVTQGAISQWLKRARAYGEEGLRRHPAPGRRASLTNEQMEQLCNLLIHGAVAYGYRDNRWTLIRIGTVLQMLFGIRYHPTHIGRLLHKHCPNWRDFSNSAQSL